MFTGSYSEKCDVYSFGLSFWEIINERRVFPRYENNLNALIKSRCENYETPPITDDMLPRLVTLLERCWDKNPRQRYVSSPPSLCLLAVHASFCRLASLHFFRIFL